MTTSIGNRRFDLVRVDPIETTQVELHFGNMVSSRDAMKILGVSRMTLINLARKGRLTRHRVKNNAFYPWPEVAALLGEGYGQPVSAPLPPVGQSAA